MIDPETARQAVTEWREVTADCNAEDDDLRIVEAGDALAVLVPQLLDQLAAAHNQVDEYLGMLTRQQVRHDQSEAALGERCRQLETALRKMVDWHERGDQNLPDQFPRFCSDLDRARAALGDPKETDE